MNAHASRPATVTQSWNQVSSEFETEFLLSGGAAGGTSVGAALRPSPVAFAKAEREAE